MPGTIDVKKGDAPAGASSENVDHRIRFPRDVGLSLTLLGIFLVLAALQSVVGQHALNDDLREHGRPPISYASYFGTGFCWEAFSENWESEFLEMGAFVWLTSFLFQRGSPESKDPQKSAGADEPPLAAHSPWAARQGGWIRAVYARSLAIAFLFLFFIAFAIHAVSGASEYNRQQLLHGEQSITAFQFLGTSNFWFQSLQNWQSEFLGILSMVVLSIWFRQGGSPESKPVNAPHWQCAK